MTSDRILQAACFAFPAVAMAAAHWFPWRRLFRRDLHRLESYAIGTTAIVGTAALAISASDGDGKEHSRMLLLAALGAGLMTIAAYIIDEFTRQRADNVRLQAEREVLHHDDVR